MRLREVRKAQERFDPRGILRRGRCLNVAGRTLLTLCLRGILRDRIVIRCLGYRAAVRDFRWRRAESFDQRLESPIVIVREIDVLQACQAKGDFTFKIEYRDDPFALAQRERKFIADVVETDGRGGKNDEDSRSRRQRLFDRAVPRRSGLDINLIQPHVCAGCLEILGKPERKCGIGPAVAAKREWLSHVSRSITRQV